MGTPDGVVCAETDPLGDGPVLLGLLGQLVLDEESLLGRLHRTHTEPSLLDSTSARYT